MLPIATRSRPTSPRTSSKTRFDPRPAVYLDECVDHALAPALQERGFAATTAYAEGRTGDSDEEQLAYASERGFVLLSHNWRHFQRQHAALRQRGQPHGGIVILPASSPLPQLVIRSALLLDWLAALPTWRSQLFRWGDLQARLTQGAQLPGYSEADVRLALGQDPQP